MVPEQQKQKVPIAKAHAPYSQSPCSVTDAVDIQVHIVKAVPCHAKRNPFLAAFYKMPGLTYMLCSCPR